MFPAAQIEFPKMNTPFVCPERQSVCLYGDSTGEERAASRCHTR